MTKNEQIIALLNEILNHQVANRGTNSAFYICYAYDNTFPEWVEKAEKMIKHLKR